MLLPFINENFGSTSLNSSLPLSSPFDFSCHVTVYVNICLKLYWKLKSLWKNLDQVDMTEICIRKFLRNEKCCLSFSWASVCEDIHTAAKTFFPASFSWSSNYTSNLYWFHWINIVLKHKNGIGSNNQRWSPIKFDRLNLLVLFISEYHIWLPTNRWSCHDRSNLEKCRKIEIAACE